MALVWDQDEVINWSMTERSPCFVFKARDTAGIMQALTMARTRGLPVIPHGAGHSYTDAALNTNGVIIDVTGMRRILSWEPQRGIIQVEPGVTVRDVVQLALPDRWWLPVTPSTAEATIGGCVAMNVNGKNAWKCGSFGEHVLSLTVLLASGEALTVSPESDQELFQALVGSAGLLGIITSVTLQLQRVPSAHVDLRLRPAIYCLHAAHKALHPSGILRKLEKTMVILLIICLLTALLWATGFLIAKDFSVPLKKAWQFHHILSFPPGCSGFSCP